MFSVSKSCPTLCDPMDCSMPGFPVLHYLPKFIQTYAHWVSDALQSSHPLSPPSLLALNLPSIRIFSSESAVHIRWPKYWSFSFSIYFLTMNIPGWFPLGLSGLISLLSKGLSRVFQSTTVWKHQFFSTQPSLWSNSNIHTWLLVKTIALSIWTSVGKVMSLLFNTLSRFAIAFLPRRKLFFCFMLCLLILWLQPLSPLILEPKKMESDSFHIFPIYLLSSDGAGCHDFSFLNVVF